MPKDRHRGRKIQFWLSDDDVRRFDRLRGAGCKTDKDSFIKLLESAEAGKQESEVVHNKLKTSDSQIDKLLHDLKDRDRKIEELGKQAKFGEQKLTATMALLKEKNEEMATLQTDNEQLREQCQFSKIEGKVEHQVMEKPQVIERTVEKTEKTIVKEIVPPAAVIIEKVSCPHFAKAINQPEITKEQCIKIQKYRPELCRNVQCCAFTLSGQP